MINPVIKNSEGCVFRENFINSTYVSDNGITLYNAPTINNGMTLNGTTQYAALNEEFKYNFGDGASDKAFSVEAVIIMTDATSFTIFSKGVYNTDDEWRLATGADDKIYWQMFDESVADCYIGRKRFAAVTAMEGQSMHVIATYDGSGTAAGCKIYINGFQVDDTDASNNAVSYVAMEKQGHVAQIGRDAALYANGIFKQVSIYNRELTAGEVADKAQQVTFREVDVRQLEFFLPLRTHYNNGVSELTPNLGIVGGDTIKWGDGNFLKNNGVSFDGVGDYIGITSAFNTDNTTTYCFGGLFQYKSVANSILFDFRNAAVNGFGLQMRTTDLLLFRDALLTGADGVGNYNDGTWHSVICVLTPSAGSTIYSIYVDGKLDVTNTTTAFTNATAANFYIGCDYAVANFYSGNLKFPFLWHIDLTPTQVKWQHETLFRQINL